ncbi:spectrin beta chain, non-erythrocytic 1 isoform X2 [Chrysoperla carnea]|uniref:spectrin beta chain, non-erythrocytic 1 isoform X2 n=1 Tax=Chrysoperla carnea TaxID=189513 RepID=UPI001D08D597|nr:spectrin beta chain, non-erythrocytic 1 isoform X2 [Chrysoperla carnea]
MSLNRSRQYEYSNGARFEPSVQYGAIRTTYYRSNMTQRDDVHKFEQGRIRALQEERLHIQKKTFTKWMNSFLQKARMEVDDLFTDLADGKKLLKLLEIISGEKLAKPNNGKMRVHKIENVNKSLAFLHTKVRLESIGAEDIVDGNPRLILGLIWTIILRFQIQEIEIDVDEENESSEKKSAKDALLLWCQRKTSGYPGVNINDFTTSWRSGLGFNALIHSHRPDLFPWDRLQPGRNIENLNHAFDVANSELGIPRLLDAEDVDTTRPDEKSILTYVASYYHTFARMKNEMKSGRRIANIVGQMMDADKMKLMYEKLLTTLLEWIRLKVIELEDRKFPNSMEGIQALLFAFGQYRTVEKPPKYKERSEIEALYFNINTQLKWLQQGPYVPPEGKYLHDLEKAWESLERSEHRREVALRKELLRQERLEQLNYKFERKSVLREGYLKEMIQVLSDPRYGSNIAQVDATVKKHEAISADILAREERFHDLTNMSEELVRENYHGTERVKNREAEVLERWSELLELLDKHKNNLTLLCTLMSILREIETTMGTIEELQLNFQSGDVGNHLLAVEDLRQGHSLQELQVAAVGETVRRLTRQAQQHSNVEQHKDAPVLEQSIANLQQAYENLILSSKKRRELLDDARNFYQFIQDQEDEEAWLIEKQRICKTGISAKDLRAVLSLQQKHKVLQDEMNARKPKSDQLCEAGLKLIADKHPKATDIQPKINSIQENWKILHDLSALRKKQLDDAAVAYQFYTDANEADSWLNEKMALVTSNDYGLDEPSAQALLQRHRDLQGELNAYSGDIQSLNSQADKLIKAGISTLELTAGPEPVQEAQREEWVNETRLVPTEVWEEEPIEKIEHRTVLEERSVPQIKALYPFTGQDGMVMAKNEVMFLLNKTNPDWWSVRKADGTDGFVPANYVREIEPRIIQIQVRRPEKIKTIQRVKKVKMVKQVIPVKRSISVKKPIPPPKRKFDDNDNVEKRLKKINSTYDQLQDLAVKRHALLEDSIRLFGFYRECDDFEKWIKDKENFLKTDDSKDNVETAKRKYEKFVTDLSASSKRIEALDNAVEQFVQQGHSQLDKVKARHRQIHQLWDHLNRLKAQKERSLEGASSVELFNRTCDEATDWMSEKMTQLDTAELGPDLRTVQALQRRHQNLERELAPVEEKVNRVNLLANTVKSSYPHERSNVNARQKQILDLWEQVKQKAIERRSRLENAVGQQIFMNGSRGLLNWVSDVKEQLNADTSARDVETAQNLLKNHNELGEDIKAHSDEFREVTSLGKQLLQRNPHLSEIAERIERLQAENQAVKRGWAEKNDWLQQCLNLQLFNREADQIDASTSGHEAFLEFNKLGSSLDEVEALLKRHDDFENTLFVQDERIKSFREMADKLIADDHYDSKNIEDRKNQVIARRQAVKNNALARRQALLASRHFQEFSAEVDDLKDWLVDKSKTAADESYRDLSNLERKLQKHEAFERELRANEGQLRNVNKTGQSLISQNNYRKSDVGQMLSDLNNQWEQLVSLSLDKGRRLRQAAAQHGYNRTIDDARLKLEEIEKCLQSRQVGHDLRSCKELLKKHQVLENDISQWKQRVDDLVNAGEEMAHEGHFDSANIIKASKVCQDKFKSLEEPCLRRREALEESLRFHKFGFELDAEMQWIGDHYPLASSDVLGQNLYQAQSLYKKHKKLQEEIKGHQPMIEKTLQSGQALIDQHHPEKQKIESLCAELQDAWDDLQEKAEDRAKKLNLSLKAQEFFFEASEVESWLNERSDVLSSTDYGRDRDAATKLLTKHKALELELDTYNGIVTEMGHNANAMVTAKHPDSKAILTKHQLLAQQLRSLQRIATVRQQRLMESMYRHEYFLESAELEQWIKEQEISAASEDYGQDYEHLLVLQAKFDDFKHRIEAGSERFNQCEELAQKLIANDSPYSQDIERRQEQLRDAWKRLLGLIKHRSQRLEAAAQIHRYHRDTAELLARVQQKLAELGTQPGRDLHAVLALLRRHEVFENDLVALDAQLQILIEDAAKLEEMYPANANTVIPQRDAVLVAWEELQKKTAERKEKLEASCDLQKFLAQVRDLMNWSSNLRATMSTEVKVRDAAGAQILKAEHDAIKNEIEAREDNFHAVIDLSEAMIQTGHYAALDVEDKRTQLLAERDKLYAAWRHKQIYLDQLIDLHLFLREAKQIDTLSSTQEAALNGTNFGTTVDEVDVLAKKHDAFEKLLQAQDEKVISLKQRATNLVNQDHFEKDLILKRLDEVIAKRLHVKKLSAYRRQQLDDSLLYAQFIRDVTEANLWIEEKQKKLEAEANKGEVSNLEDKIKKLQKHQAFQAELSANEGRIQEITNKGDTLIEKRHHASNEIKQQMNDLLSRWHQLLEDSDSHGRGLEEAQDILEFNNQLDKIEAWIRDKEMMIQANDTGRDYEHCMALQRKLDDVDSDMRVDDQRIKAINNLADKLIRQGPSETKTVQQRRDSFIKKWKALQGALSSYRETLAGALEVHLFNRDVNDTGARIYEKSVALATNETGRDLADVEILQRKQETLERDMTAIEGKIKEHDQDAKKLSNKYPGNSEEIIEKLTAVKNDWNNLRNASQKRTEALAAAYTLEKFKTELRDLESWVADTIKRMDAADAPNTIADAEAAIELHSERKAEIDGRQDTFKALREHGLSIAKNKEVDTSASLEKIEELRNMLNNAWEQRKVMLTQAHQLQLFKDQVDQIDSWLATKEAFLNNDDLGDSLSSVEALLRKHDAFEKMLQSQLSRVDELQRFAEDILNENHYDSDAITKRLQGVIARRNRLLDSSNNRKKKLTESLHFQQFLRNVYEVENWLTQKLQIASDESYRDPSNLQTKIQKHITFDAELVANRGRISSIITEGEELISENHFASDEIQMQIDELENEWRHLQEQSQLKSSRLEDAYQALLFTRQLDEFELWMDEIESQLKSDDHGKDIATVTNLLKKHTTLENDVLQHNENYQIIKDTNAAFQKSQHFMWEEIDERAQLAIKRYAALQNPMQVRRELLEDSLLFQQFLRDVEEEQQWLDEKEPLVKSNELGTNLNAVQSLQKKHQALEAELVVREPIVTNLVARAQQMIRAGHFASTQIDEISNDLNNKLIQLRDIASVRRLRLLDAVESQMFYTEANEADIWITEKRATVSTTDCGKDENSVQLLLKKLDGFDRELSTFKSTIEKLYALSNGLIDRRHFDSDNIAAKQEIIEQKYSELQLLSKKRRERLNQALEFFKFIRESDEVQEWIVEQTKIADSEDYGTDVEHVELLIQTFDTFHARLVASEGRVTVIQEIGNALIAKKNPDSEKIKLKLDETQQLWEGLKDLAQARQEALAGAKQVHVFDRTADETISWIAEKESSLATDDYGHDLESIQALGRSHQGFETDLAAVRKQVDAVAEEATRLAYLFPDAREHVEVKNEETFDAWNDLLDKAAQRKDKLKQAEQLQSYFDEYRDLMAWINEMVAKITSSELAQDVTGAEALIARHLEHKAEIETRKDAFAKFYKVGAKLIQDGHFLANEVEDKISVLKQRKDLLDDTWEKRRVIYDQNLDTQLFKREAEALENWIQAREPMLHDGKLGDTIPQVEELIRKHEDFEKTIEAQEEKFNAIKRITMLERAFQKQREIEFAAKQAERERIEKERVEAIKRKEMKRITEERRREDGLHHHVNMNGNSGNHLDVPPPTVKVISHPEPEHTSLTKSNSIAHMFGDRLRRGSDASIKRAESMKINAKPPKRTPSFTTRRRTQSFRKVQDTDPNSLPPLDIEGFLERKHELASGGKKANVRSWKNLYTVLCGQLLCFFKNKDDFVMSKAAASPVVIMNAKCEIADDYTKKKHAFRLTCTDNSEFLFIAANEKEMHEWINKITFHAKLPPSQQLLSYDEGIKTPESMRSRSRASTDNTSTASSQTSSPDSQRRLSVGSSSTITEASTVSSVGPQTQFLQQHQHHIRQHHVPMSPTDKPPIPPRGAPPPVPVRGSETLPVVMRRTNSQDNTDSGRPVSYHSMVRVNNNNSQQNGSTPVQGEHWGRSVNPENQYLGEIPPPLPATEPPMKLGLPPTGRLDGNSNNSSTMIHHQWQQQDSSNYNSNNVIVFQPQAYGSNSRTTNSFGRPISMPPVYMAGNSNSTTDTLRRGSDVSVDGEVTPRKEKDRKILGLFSRKKRHASQT